VALDPKFDPFLDSVDTSTAAKSLTIDQLLEMRAQIDAQLPVKDLKDLDLSRELVLQVQALQALQRRVMEDTSTPANQIAQCANSLSSALSNLVKVQNEVYVSERLKRIEAILIDCLDTLPEKAQRRFFEQYERELGA